MAPLLHISAIKILTIPYGVYAIKELICYAIAFGEAYPHWQIKKNMTYWACKYEEEFGDDRGILLYDEITFIKISDASSIFETISEYFEFRITMKCWKGQLEKCKSNNKVSILY